MTQVTKKKILKTIIVPVLLIGGIIGGYFYYASQNELLDNRIIDNVVGESMANACYVLEGSDLAVTVQYAYDDGLEGVVLSTFPTAGHSVAEGSTVIITVSKHRVVGDILGWGVVNARDSLLEQGLVNVTVERVKDDGLEGVVLAVEPECGTIVQATDAITLQVSESYKVPTVIGLTQAEAVLALEEAGYVPVVELLYDETSAEGIVLKCAYSEGTKVQSGTEVTISVATHDEAYKPAESEEGSEESQSSQA